MAGEVFRHRERVIYAHCTIGNHVYHSRYLDMLEEARGEFMRAIGFPLQKLQDDGYFYPVLEARIRYLAMARYDDELIIEVWIRTLTRVRLTICHRILLATGKVILEAETDHVALGMDEKPRRSPPELVTACERFVVTVA